MATVQFQTGIVFCGLNYFTANDTNWNLMGSSGPRTFQKHVTFPTAFLTTPVFVYVAVQSFYIIEDGCTMKLSVGVNGSTITASGFDVQVYTWDQCQVAGCGVSWIAGVQ